MNYALALLLLASCASLDAEVDTLPALENRTLRISTEVPGFEYTWRECTRRGAFGRCTRVELRKETYDLRDNTTRDKLINMGFVGRRRDQPLAPTASP